MYLFADEGTAGKHFQALASRETRECYGEEIGNGLKKAAGPAGPVGAKDVEVGEPRTSRISLDLLGD